LRETAAVDDVLKQAARLSKTERHILASICAGVPTEPAEKPLPAGARKVRVMPNTPMLVDSEPVACVLEKCAQRT